MMFMGAAAIRPILAFVFHFFFTVHEEIKNNGGGDSRGLFAWH